MPILEESFQYSDESITLNTIYNTLKDDVIKCYTIVDGEPSVNTVFTFLSLITGFTPLDSLIEILYNMDFEELDCLFNIFFYVGNREAIVQILYLLVNNYYNYTRTLNINGKYKMWYKLLSIFIFWKNQLNPYEEEYLHKNLIEIWVSLIKNFKYIREGPFEFMETYMENLIKNMQSHEKRLNIIKLNDINNFWNNLIKCANIFYLLYTKLGFIYVTRNLDIIQSNPGIIGKSLQSYIPWVYQEIDDDNKINYLIYIPPGLQSQTDFILEQIQKNIQYFLHEYPDINYIEGDWEITYQFPFSHPYIWFTYDILSNEYPFKLLTAQSKSNNPLDEYEYNIFELYPLENLTYPVYVSRLYWESLSDTLDIGKSYEDRHWILVSCDENMNPYNIYSEYGKKIFDELNINILPK
jgi:hypothetical protein